MGCDLELGLEFRTARPPALFAVLVFFSGSLFAVDPVRFPLPSCAYRASVFLGNGVVYEAV